jgi:putative membrane-bound dehydrogenase-like protein
VRIWTAVAVFLCHLSLAANELPRVPAGFAVSVFAQEPLIRNPCAMTFDGEGRLFVSQGVQYRSPRPETPGDRISILIDEDGDGKADRSKPFAQGFNHIQDLAWRGDELWVAAAPELVVLRDLDGDDVADEYKLLYGGLGNLEHALHGLNFGPDGRVYMSKGNSKGYLQADSPEKYVAPKAFAELWGEELPAGAPDIPAPITFKPQSFQRGYHNPNDDWGREGGMLSCLPDGSDLRIHSRGCRNPWDVAYDENFDWLATDQDQDGGDRIIRPFQSAHFGWGHAWSPHWTGENHLPTVPISGPNFDGSGTGVIYCASQAFPKRYRGVYFVNDWLKRTTFVYRPKWEGGHMNNPATPEIFAAAPTGRAMGSSKGVLYDVTDLEMGPDGALWVMSWGHGYGARFANDKQIDEGHVYRIYPEGLKNTPVAGKYQKPYPQWTEAELIDDLQHDRLPCWRIDAADELVRRGPKVAEALQAALEREALPPGAAIGDVRAAGNRRVSCR